jgi:probable rRNA maturation factor
LLHLAGFDHGEVMFDMTDAAVDRVLDESGGGMV